ncbi:hypothetical protein MMC19_001872 [Ptychographa xylographoides]|nr:hypothetical protein [Ptychographa xylographoides]
MRIDYAVFRSYEVYKNPYAPTKLTCPCGSLTCTETVFDSYLSTIQLQCKRMYPFPPYHFAPQWYSIPRKLARRGYNRGRHFFGQISTYNWKSLWGGEQEIRWMEEERRQRMRLGEEARERARADSKWTEKKMARATRSNVKPARKARLRMKRTKRLGAKE